MVLLSALRGTTECGDDERNFSDIKRCDLRKGTKMTSPEKIEELLKQFGQTISDLPSTKDYDWSRNVYEEEQMKQAKKTAYAWMWDEYADVNTFPIDVVEPPLLDFICHQSDVIERLINALETAEKIVSCDYCVKHESKCGNCSGYECTGFQMADIEKLKKEEEERL